MIEQLKRFVGPLDRRVRSMIMRATVSGVDDTQDLQVLQVTRLEGETIDGCERIGQYGFTSSPPIGAEALVVQINSNADHQVIAGVDDGSRPHPLSAGQSCLYDSAGTKVMLSADGSITILTQSGNEVIVSSSGVTISAPTIHLDGNVIITGTLNGHSP